jgi:hypothetical protein
MPAGYKARFATLASAAAAWAASGAIALAQPARPAAAEHPIPQSQLVEHQETLERLAVLSKRPGAVGEAARKAIVLFRRHYAREEEYILPPLTLLPVLADGKATPDMAWALAMCDRVKADQAEIFQEHTEVTNAANALYSAGLVAHDQDAMEFARAAVTDSLNDLELLEPTVLLIGEHLRMALAPTR